MDMDKIKSYLLVLLFVTVLALASTTCSQFKEVSRLNSNYAAMCDSAKTYKTKSGMLATTNKNLELTYKELIMLYGDSLNDIRKELKITKRALSGYQKGNVGFEIHDTVRVSDTVYKDGTIHKVGEYNTECISIGFNLFDTTIVMNAAGNIPIDVFVYTSKEGKWWKFWTWPRKKVATTTATSRCEGVKVDIVTSTIK